MIEITPVLKPGTKVRATLQHFHTKGTRQADLIYVEEDDVNWRTADDGSEVSYDWDVIDWKVLDPWERR